MNFEHRNNEVLFVVPVTKKLSSLSYNAKGIQLSPPPLSCLNSTIWYPKGRSIYNH